MIVRKIFQKIKEIIEKARALPYEKRLALLQISLISSGLILVILWFGIFKSEISSTHPLAVNEVQEEKVQNVSRWEIFKKGLYLAYSESFLPLLKKLGEGLADVFGLMVELVIKIFNITSYALRTIFFQYKSYAQLIHYIFIR
jgi:hypothetical protein